MPPNSIDTTGLPQQVVEDIQKLVQTLRDKLARPEPKMPPVKLPLWQGTVLGPMERRELYEDGE
jgi:hypothetical protein